MKVIDLLNKIANGEEVPMFKYEGHRYEYSKVNEMFEDLDNDERCKSEIYFCELNDEVEILEEEKEQVKPLTKKDIEALGYACGEIQKCFTNGWTKSLENKPLEEEKKIPEKLDEIAYVDGEISYSWSKSGVILKNKINSIIDYLKSKGV